MPAEPASGAPSSGGDSSSFSGSSSLAHTVCFWISLANKPHWTRNSAPFSWKTEYFQFSRCGKHFFPTILFLCFSRHMIFITSPLSSPISYLPPLFPLLSLSFRGLIFSSLSVFCCGRFFLCSVLSLPLVAAAVATTGCSFQGICFVISACVLCHSCHC